ncbi:MAG: hypothetical protein KZQ59_07560 [Candidatus Thiodiazotropha sp. (ex Lucinoma aequizonata)]|nr:hypothetical protein [Candidatus Thiodiazotropha sp. (ex Lucinoma aequizonata)]MCU7900194.1 hypothetical protein [Candidatus Thiodiazotropha sp. (ex Lucinoma aequizonata)]
MAELVNLTDPKKISSHALNTPVFHHCIHGAYFRLLECLLRHYGKSVTIQPILPWLTRLGLMHLHEIRFFALKKQC